MRIMFKKRRADAPIVATIMLMAITLFVMSIALSFVNNTLTRREGENDFESAKIFMKNVGLQVDDVAWTEGRVDTVHFTSQYGQVEFLPHSGEPYPLKYTVTYNYLDADGMEKSDEEYYYSSILMYNLPIDKSFLGEGYDEAILPKNVNSARELKPVASGTTAPVANVFAIQKSNVGADQYLRIVLVPVMRYHEYYVSSSGPQTNLGYSTTPIKINIQKVTWNGVEDGTYGSFSVTIENPGGSSVDLDSLTLKNDESGSTSYSLAGTTIDAGKSLTITKFIDTPSLKWAESSEYIIEVYTNPTDHASYSSTTPTVERHMKLYLPELILNVGIPQPKSIVMTGDGIKSTNYNSVTSITVKVEFPRTSAPGFSNDNYDNLFFKFNPKEVTIPMSYQYQVETYIGRVKLDYGT